MKEGCNGGLVFRENNSCFLLVDPPVSFTIITPVLIQIMGNC